MTSRGSRGGHAADGDAFGVKHVGLPDTPQRLLDRGYSVIHSVKSDARVGEEEIRAFYRQRRAADPAGAGAAGAAAAAPQLRLTAGAVAVRRA